MKSFLIASILFLFVEACKTENLSNLNKDIDLYQNELVHLDAKHKLNFEATEINDSRCPEGVTCVWEGYASVIIKVKSENTDITDLKLCTGACNAIGSKELLFNVNNDRYKVSLIAIQKGKADRLKAVIRVSGY
ncbi:hypothetical protein WG906_06635 [Pedobacter sp. P351]|uniref:hypothetical protein n=1 Tax=Pedobacter superstes TaxID=3133441 RepID=UPI0030B7F0BE